MIVKLTDTQRRALILFAEQSSTWMGKVRPQTIRALIAAGLVTEHRISCDGHERTRTEITEAGRAAIGAANIDTMSCGETS
jgi:hypothetical protein